MMRRILFCGTLLAILGLPATGHAAGYRQHRTPLPAPYLAFFLGVSSPVDTDINGSNGGVPFEEHAEFDSNIDVGGSAGFDFGMVRLEGELSYKHAEFSTVTDRQQQVKYVNADGRAGALAVLFNTFIDLHNDSAFTPYFGGGIGFATVQISDTYGTRADTGTSTLLYISDNDTVFAYQAGGGLGIALTPIMTLDLGYRFFGTSKASFGSTYIKPEFELQSHNATVGLRFTF